MRNVGKVMRLDTAMWSFRIRIWQLMGLMDILLLVLALADISEALAAFASLTAALTGVILIKPFFNNHKNGIDGLLITMPFRRREIVIGHFMYGLGWNALLNINAMVVGSIVTMLFQPHAVIRLVIWPYAELILLLALLMALFYFFLLSLALHYAQIILIILITIVGVVALHVLPNGTIIPGWDGELTVIGLAVSVFGTIIVLLISMWLSIELYNRKEI